MLIRPGVCLPYYNHSGTVLDVVRRTLTSCRYPVVVVDDGSDVSQFSLSDALMNDEICRKAQEEGRLTLVRHTENLGKGKAIQTAIKVGVSKAWTHLFTLDTDGQHYPEDIPAFSKSLIENPHSLFIGKREFESETSGNIPKISKFGRKFSNFWVKYQTGESISDSQSGFRVYPLFFVQTMRFFTSRYDFEIEILIRLIWKGIALREVPIRVLYQPGDLRVSHFRKFYDNARITFLNTGLIVFQLLRVERKPFLNSLSLAVGVWIGCTPLFGLHAPIGAGLSFLFRLNFVLIFIGTQISNPFFLPFLISTEMVVGQWILGTSEKMFLSWWVGSLGVGFILGMMVLLLALGFQKEKAPTRQWSGRIRGGRLGNQFMKWVTGTLGLRMGYRIVALIIPYFYLFAPRARKGLHEYWRVIDPQLSYGERVRKIIFQLRVFGEILLDRMAQLSGGNRNLGLQGTSDGIHHIMKPIQEKKGLVLVGAHFGGWDIATSFLPDHGVEDRLHMVRYEADGLTLERVTKTRDPNVQWMDPVRQPQILLSIYGLLREGQAVAFMGDRPLSDRYQMVQLLGALCIVDSVPFISSAASGASLVFSFGVKERSTQTYHFWALPQEALDSGKPSEKTLFEACQRFADRLGEAIQENPEQWFNFYQYFSTTPRPLLGRNEILEAI